VLLLSQSRSGIKRFPMDEATKKAALIAVLVFNMIVIVWMITASLLNPMTPWLMRALPAVVIAAGVAGGTFYFMKR